MFQALPCRNGFITCIDLTHHSIICSRRRGYLTTEQSKCTASQRDWHRRRALRVIGTPSRLYQGTKWTIYQGTKKNELHFLNPTLFISPHCLSLSSLDFFFVTLYSIFVIAMNDFVYSIPKASFSLNGQCLQVIQVIVLLSCRQVTSRRVWAHAFPF